MMKYKKIVCFLFISLIIAGLANVYAQEVIKLTIGQITKKAYINEVYQVKITLSWDADKEVLITKYTQPILKNLKLQKVEVKDIINVENSKSINIQEYIFNLIPLKKEKASFTSVRFYYLLNNDTKTIASPALEFDVYKRLPIKKIIKYLIALLCISIIIFLIYIFVKYAKNKKTIKNEKLVYYEERLNLIKDSQVNDFFDNINKYLTEEYNINIAIESKEKLKGLLQQVIDKEDIINDFIEYIEEIKKAKYSSDYSIDFSIQEKLNSIRKIFIEKIEEKIQQEKQKQKT